MAVKDLINTEIPVLHLGDSIQEGFAKMKKHNINCLPVVEGSRYMGLLQLSLEPTHGTDSKPIEERDLFSAYISLQNHINEAVDKVSQTKLDLLPVVTNTMNYLGCVEIHQLITDMAWLCQTGHPGAILQMEMNPRDFSAAHIAGIIEDCGAHIVNLFSYPDLKSRKMIVHLKVDREDATEIIRSLERFEYLITKVHQHETPENNSLKQKLNELMFYLDM